MINYSILQFLQSWSDTFKSINPISFSLDDSEKYEIGDTVIVNWVNPYYNKIIKNNLYVNENAFTNCLKEEFVSKYCEFCEGTGRVCEDHPYNSWSGDNDCCGSPGMPCECRSKKYE